MNTLSSGLPLGNGAPAKKLSDVLRELDQGAGDRISLGDLITALGERSFVPLMILFSLPNVFFFVPGSSVITGLPLIFILCQLILGRPAVWLPKVLNERFIEHVTFTRIVIKAVPWIEWVERMARPRYWPFSRVVAERVVGLTSLVMAIFMFLPIPFANALPAVSVITLALGLGEHDGVWLAGGVVASLVSTVIVCAIFSAGTFAMLSFF
ncbi:exopolysaccharide biosynthesis protein [Falsihalocynthiibacter sp. CO-5D18]|uniref:exopolysaccharide biosynthesis protein n=1 Tax=Falsihalocynthiibacter sp. CO-5D18 TaxID=3240872 RepID=UPI00350F67D9